MISSIAIDRTPAVGTVQISVVDGTAASRQADVLAVEEPLEIRVGIGPHGNGLQSDHSRLSLRERKSLSRSERRQSDATGHRAVCVTMRTPGNDEELAAGFLWTEGIVTSAEQIRQVRACGPRTAGGSRNTVRVELQPDAALDLARLERHFYMTSSCGVCGKSSLEAVRVCRRPLTAASRPILDAGVVHQLPARLRAAQGTFDSTGGLHAAGLFDLDGTLLAVREDVGRHNAVDKVIGCQLLAKRLPISDGVLMLSGRASFELVQKAMMAGIPIVAAIGTPSSLAVELARDCGITVLGFVRGQRFNIYTGGERIRATT